MNLCNSIGDESNLCSIPVFWVITFISLSTFQSATSQGNQSQKIRGSVTDNETGETLPGVHVYISTTTIGTVTKENGTFGLKHSLNGSFKLVASFVGYNTQSKEVRLNRENEVLRSILNFLLSLPKWRSLKSRLQIVNGKIILIFSGSIF